MRDINVAITGTLDASAQTVTFNTAIDKNKLLTIVNTTANVEIYTANDATNGGTLNGGNTVLTVDYDTTAMSDADLLQVIYEGVASTALSTAAKQDVGNASLAAIDIQLGGLATETSASQAAASLTNIEAVDFATESTLSNANIRLGLIDDGIGDDITTPSPAMPAGGSGVRGWLSAIWTKLNATLAVTGPLTDAELRAATVPVSGTVTVNALPAGSAIIGNVRIDQTTPGTTNGVQVSAALPAGNNNIGDVDVASIVPGTGATNLGKAEDAAHASGDVGVMSLGVRNDTAASFGSAEGDYVPDAADQYGNSRVRGPSVPTYMVATATFTPAASATDIFEIKGSGSKTVRVVRVIVSGTQTNLANIGNLSILKRSTANTGGTPVASTIVPTDSGFSAGTATVQHYTANPTTGTLVGPVWNPRGLFVATGTNNSGIITDLNLQDLLNGTGIVLRGTAESLVVNLGGTTASGAALFQVTAVFTEE